MFVFLSDAYLRSPNCMFELLRIWQTSAAEPDRFLNRIRVFTMPGTDIFGIAQRMKYGMYWKEQREAIQKLIQEGGADVLGERDFKNWRNIQEFAHHVNEMLAHIADVLQARKFDEYAQAAIDELLQRRRET